MAACFTKVTHLNEMKVGTKVESILYRMGKTASGMTLDTKKAQQEFHPHRPEQEEVGKGKVVKPNTGTPSDHAKPNAGAGPSLTMEDGEDLNPSKSVKRTNLAHVSCPILFVRGVAKKCEEQLEKYDELREGFN